MKYIYFLLCILFSKAESRIGRPMFVTTPPSIEGFWYQVYSSRHVQETSEIDWECITASIRTEGDSITIKKSGILHNFRELNSSVEKEYTWTSDQDGGFMLQPVFPGSILNYPMQIFYQDKKDSLDSYFYLLGSDQLSLFVFARDYDKFMEKEDTECLNEIAANHFDSYPQSPTKSFEKDCLPPFFP